MDDLEFRRALLADPNAQSEEIKRAIADDPAKKHYVDEMRVLNAKIDAAAKVDVPEDLASKLILRQAMESQEDVDDSSDAPVKLKAANDANYWQIAAAACVAFVIGLMINVSSLQPEGNLAAGEYALTYSYKDVQQAEQSIPLEEVNAQLASYGVQMEQEIGPVMYANSYHCNYNNVSVLRLVVEGEAGKINMYILPKDNRLGGWDEFSDSRFNGKASRYSNADMVIVGEKGEPLHTFQSRVENSMRWAI
ncbi:DUF3379 family protein [Alteromonas sp. ASW11-36]|uniref:DUF3379 family protein n=1 Tax=Alteromonas arenosi TaxID=3055817 RepID=A0ABT7SY37_9ALTE|nr:DUF3379 family protein [Alteromonas sp. ASW11-36]MDM7861091.1 DUF3379 family protein [Alteromonas sp. ASW11-36]